MLRKLYAAILVIHQMHVASLNGHLEVINGLARITCSFWVHRFLAHAQFQYSSVIQRAFYVLLDMLDFIKGLIPGLKRNTQGGMPRRQK